jgi:DNA-binding NarL/FixJ family response regulator
MGLTTGGGIGQVTYPETGWHRFRPQGRTRGQRTMACVGSDDVAARGRAALDAGRWGDARAAFEASLEREETPEAHEGLGRALWWLCEPRGSARHRERAFVLSRQAGDHARASRVSVDLAMTYLYNLGNESAARGWLARGERAGQAVDSNPARGWLSLVRGYFEADPARARDLYEQALAVGRDTGDADLELSALADLGMTLVVNGQADEGIGLLDEAMAGSLGGEGGSLETVANIFCSMLVACQQTGDLDRAAQWSRVTEEFMREYACPFPFAQCNLHYGCLLYTKGHWTRAQSEFQAALQLADDWPDLQAEVLARLAELRIRQGRLEEADLLLARCDETGIAAPAAAELRLARGEASAAVELLEQRMENVGDDAGEAARALTLLVEAEVACGDLAAARAGVASLQERARADGGPLPVALAALTTARVHAVEGSAAACIERLQQAVDAFATLDLPFETARARLELAGALVDERPTIAAAEAKNAHRAFEQMGATACAGEAASLLRSLGERVRPSAKGAGVLTSREEEVLALVALGLSNPEIAERLFISRRTAAHHVSNILTKLGLRNRAELVAYASRPGARTGDARASSRV